jgi:hypothetical protein
MKWFYRWTIVAAVLVSVVVVAWWFYFVDLRPGEFWIVLLSTGLGSVFIGGLMVMGSTESLEESDQVFPYSSFKSAGLKGADINQHLKQRIIQGIEASAAVWAFVVVGVTTVLISMGFKYLAF